MRYTTRTSAVGGIRKCCPLSNFSRFYWIFAILGQNFYGHNLSVRFDNQLDVTTVCLQKNSKFDSKMDIF